MVGSPSRPSVGRPEDPSAPLPAGTEVVLDRATRRPEPGVLVGGRPRRLLRMSAAGVRALEALGTGPVSSPATGHLARRLTDAGLAHPRPAAAEPPQVTVVVPVLDRPDELARCLGALGRSAPVVVVDDGSADPGALAAVALGAGASLVRRERSGGPAAARNAGLAAVATPLVAFVDSDCEVPPGWLSTLVEQFADPLLGAVAPRVWAEGGHSPLDMGDAAGPVGPGTPVSYVPTAAFVARVCALGDGFDEGLRYGEDVDLVWRLVDAGWRVRYDPAVEVLHAEGRGLPDRLRRRYAYGTSAGPLALRHPGRLAPLRAAAWPALAVATTLAGYPVAGLAIGAAGTLRAARHAQSAGLRGLAALGVGPRALAGTLVATGRWWRQAGAPVALAVWLLPGARRRVRRLTLAAAVLAPSVSRGGSAGPAPAGMAEDLAYGAGVVTGSLKAGTWAPLLPRVGRRVL